MQHITELQHVFMRCCMCILSRPKSLMWTRQTLTCLLYVVNSRDHNSPAAEQHIQQSVLDLPVWHQCFCCWLPFGIHRYEGRRLACLSARHLSAVSLFLCPSACVKSFFSLQKSHGLLRVGQKAIRQSAWNAFFLPLYLLFSSPSLFAFLALYSPLGSFLQTSQRFKLLHPHSVSFVVKYAHLSVGYLLGAILAKCLRACRTFTLPKMWGVELAPAEQLIHLVFNSKIL